MSDEKKVALDVLKEIAKDINVEPHIRVQAAGMLLAADGGGIPIEPGKTGDEQPTEPNE